MKRMEIPQKLGYDKFHVDEKNLRTQICRREFIKNLLLEKRKEHMQTKQPRFKSRMKNADPDKYGYSVYGIGFDACSEFSLLIDEW